MAPESKAIVYLDRTLEEWKALLKDENPTQCLRAAEAIGEIGPAAGPTLVEMLKSPDPSIRYWAARGLGKLGATTPAAIAAALREAVKDPSGSVRVAAAEALYRVGERDAGLDGLIAAVSDTDPFVALRAGNVLRQIGPDAGRAVPALEAAQQSGNDYVQRIARGALKAIQDY